MAIGDSVQVLYLPDQPQKNIALVGINRQFARESVRDGKTLLWCALLCPFGLALLAFLSYRLKWRNGSAGTRV